MKETSTIQVQLPSVPVPQGNNALVLPSTTLMRHNGEPTRDEQIISEKLRTDVALQLAHAIKGEHAYRLSQTITLRGINHFEEYVTFDRAIRDKHRDNMADHADIEALCHGMRQSQVNTIMAIRNGVVNTIEEITMKPLAPDKQTEDVIIEQKPGLLGMIFGGQQVTRVRR